MAHKKRRSKAPVWVASEGGPLILMPQAALMAWCGCEPARDGRVITARSRWNGPDSPATDYDRACDVDGQVGILDVGGHTGLVLADQPLATTWVTHPRGGALVRIVSAAIERKRLIERMPRGAALDDDAIEWQPEPGEVISEEHSWSLFDAAYPGWERDFSAAVRLAPGRYQLASARLTTRAYTLWLHRLLRT